MKVLLSLAKKCVRVNRSARGEGGLRSSARCEARRRACGTMGAASSVGRTPPPGSRAGGAGRGEGDAAGQVEEGMLAAGLALVCRDRTAPVGRHRCRAWASAWAGRAT